MTTGDGLKVLEGAVDVYRGLEAEVTKLIQSREAFVAQLNENDMVQRELKLVKEGEKVFKRIGPVLVKQDLDDANANVKKRLEFIQNELQKIEKSIQEKEQKKNEAREAVVKLQQEQAAAKQAAAN